MNNQVNEIIAILTNATSADAISRKKAEADITLMADQNLGTFFLNIATIISNESLPDNIRQLSATIIKNMISNTKYCDKWYEIPLEVRQQIKQHVLSTLASSKKLIRNAAGIAIAGMCKIELPRKQWTDIFNILTNTTANPNLNIQLSSVITLGYIFQEISEKDSTDDDNAKVLNAFYTILQNNSTPLELVTETLIAMNHFHPFISRFLQDNNQKIILFQLIEKFITNTSSEIRKLAYLIFLELVRNYYDYFEGYMDKLVQITVNGMEKDIPSNSILCYEIWYAISTIESARIEAKMSVLPCRKFCENNFDKIKDTIFKQLFTNNYEQDEWTIAKAASALLTNLCDCCNFDTVIQKVIVFIGNYIVNEDANYKHAAIRAFLCIMDTQIPAYHKNLVDLVKKSIELIGNTLHDKKSPLHLQIICSEVIEKMGKNFGAEIIQEPEIFKKLFIFFKNVLREHHKAVTVHLCTSIHHFAKALPINRANTNILSEFLSDLLNILGYLAFNKSNYDITYNVTLSSFFAIGSLVERAGLDTEKIRQAFFDNLSSAFRETFNKEEFPDPEMQMSYQCFICTTVSSFLNSTKIEDNKIIEFYFSLQKLFKEKQNTFDEGMSCIGSIACALEGKFDSYMLDFIPTLTYSLQQINQYALCKSSIICTSDIIRSIGNLFYKYLDQILPIILNILESPNVDKKIKPLAFNVISDLFYSCPKNLGNYMGKIMGLLGSAITASLEFVNKQEDPENFEYFKDLREHILETLTCIFYSFTEEHNEINFVNYVSQIMMFINTICSKKYEPSYEIAKCSLGLIGDLCTTYKGEMKSLLNDEVNQYILSVVRCPPLGEDNDKISSLIKWAESSLNSAKH